MLIDYRFHLLTLVVLFLALGLGVLIGGALFTDDNLIKGQTQLVDRLERDFASIRAENRKLTLTINSLRVDLGQNREFVDWLLPKAVAGRLNGKTFALLKQEALNPGYRSDLVNLLKSGGAQVVAEIELNRDMWSQAGGTEYQRLASILAVGLRGPILSQFEQEGYIQFAGREPRPAGYVIFLGQQPDQMMLQKFAENGLMVLSGPDALGSPEERARFYFGLVEEVNQNEPDYRAYSSL